ncbi:MAG: DegT/DnrJ/EryC1/StrS family aminotransferase, partial [Acidobacteria bacterium]|nr:DegT/DnrJ/EryC1/StrS family aminotransferase [Acidobacteriota bacterium]MDW7985392.1 DegT/DnrJ/EryC1/StrS family aminotransferase [Acidobacteriota bacterium]
AERLRQLREYGWRQRFVSERVGTNSRLDEIQAACLRVKLPHLDEWNERRRTLARLYRESLQDMPVRFQSILPGAEPVYHLFVIQAPDRDNLQAFLAEHGIGTMVHYPQAVHQQPAYRHLGRRDLSVTERVVRGVLSLPMYPELSATAVRYVAGRIRAFYQG